MGVGGLVLRSHKLVAWVEEKCAFSETGACVHLANHLISTWTYYTTLGIAIATLLTLCFVPLRFLLNILLLAIFTLCEALLAGVSIIAYDAKAVMQALYAHLQIIPYTAYLLIY